MHIDCIASIVSSPDLYGIDTGGVRIPLEELLQQPNKELSFPLYDRTKQAAGQIQVITFAIAADCQCAVCA